MIDDLTPRQEQQMHLAAQAEAYIQYYQQEARSGGRSLSHEHYDVGSSRREWAEQFQ